MAPKNDDEQRPDGPPDPDRDSLGRLLVPACIAQHVTRPRYVRGGYKPRRPR